MIGTGSEPIARVRGGDDEIGIYTDADPGEEWLALVFYDYQGRGTFEFPKRLARDLGRALLEIADA